MLYLVPVQNFSFSDSTNPNQIVLFTKEDFGEELFGLIKDKFHSSTVEVVKIDGQADINRIPEAVYDLAFREQHFDKTDINEIMRHFIGNVFAFASMFTQLRSIYFRFLVQKIYVNILH